MADHLLAQVDHTIDIFDRLTNGHTQGLFLFDNAPSHQKRADDALSACMMVKGVSYFYFFQLVTLIPLGSLAPNKGWTHNKCGVRMRDGTLPNGQPQPLYFPEDHDSMPGWFKGMEVIIRERGLWPETGIKFAHSVSKFQVPSWPCGLLLLTNFIPSARFCWTEITTQRTNQVVRPHLRFLSQISLRAQLY